jgi:hypothetical protein
MTNFKLIDKYLPEYTYHEYHDTVINSSIDNCYEAAKDFNLSKSKLIKILFKIRGVPTERMNLQGLISDMGFTRLEESFPTENLLGFWARTKIEPIPNLQDFLNNTINAKIKIVWNFYFEKLNPELTRVSTETRVLCIHPVTKIFFSLYWFVIKPFSGAIRIKMLQIIKQDAEQIKSGKL